MPEEPTTTETDVQTSTDTQTDTTQQTDTTSTEESVSMERFNEVNEKLNSLEQQNEMLRQNLNLYARQSRTTESTQQPTTANDILSGLDRLNDIDIMSGPEAKDIIGGTLKQVVQQFTDALSGISVVSANPDFQDVTQSKEFKQFLQDDPQLAQSIMSSQNPMLTAYKIAKLVTGTTKQGDKTAEQQAAEALVKAAKRPQSSSAVTGAAVTSKAQQIANMTPDEFRAHREKVKNKPQAG